MSRLMKVLTATGLAIILCTCTSEDFESPWMELDTDNEIVGFQRVFFLDEQTGFARADTIVILQYR